jgi:uncharacterized protein (DUF1501 family)
MTFQPERRAFLSGAFGALTAALPPGARLAFAANNVQREPLLFVILRGGMDGLNLVAPTDDAALRAARNVALIPTTGFQLANGLTKQDWRLHPSAPELAALYASGHLAIVHAAGSPFASRSHFEMQQLLETGTIDLTQIGPLGGWLGRYALQTGVAGTFAIGGYGMATTPTSVSSDYAALDILNASSFKLSSAEKFALLQSAYAAPTMPSAIDKALTVQVQDMLAGVHSFAAINANYVTPVAYGKDQLSTGLSIAAALMKAGAGLQLGAFEYDNWDTHTSQASRFPPSVADISKAIGAFWNDITGAGLRATLVVVSEFGRRVAGNAGGGTDHGHGNAMLVLGASVIGGRMYGNWPGLAPQQLDGGDLAITTDARRVFLEIIAKRRGDAPAGLFPNLANAAPLGLISAGP